MSYINRHLTYVNSDRSLLYGLPNGCFKSLVHFPIYSQPMLYLMKTENVSFVALVLFSLFLPSLIPSASANTSLKNGENVTSLNFINDEISGSVASDDNND